MVARRGALVREHQTHYLTPLVRFDSYLPPLRWPKGDMAAQIS